MTNPTISGKVYFIGAGPGDPDLLTRKAWKLLTAAEVVLHDGLVPPEIVRLAPAGAIVVNVGRRCGAKSITQDELHALMISQARAGRTVIRLQGGDPLIFGRAGEEIATLEEADVAFEIVPGITAASAAAAAAKISLTHRKLASKVIFLSAHRRSGRLPDGWPNGWKDDWKSLPASGATLVVYMPGGNYRVIADNLRAAGLQADVPCVIVSGAGTGRQIIRRVDLSSLGQTPGLPAPAILIVGEVTRAETRELVAAALSGTSTANEDTAT